MLGKKKPKILVWCVTSLLIYASCGPDIKQKATAKAKFQEIQGETQGTTYGIKIVEGPVEITKKAIDSILHNFDMSLSGYIPESIVSQVNAAENNFVIPDHDIYFQPCYAQSKKIFKVSDGAFDPTVLPLMKLWGFLKDTKNVPNQRQIDSVMMFVGFQDEATHIVYLKEYLDREDLPPNDITLKKKSHLQLDFNAIAQGYSVDVIGDYLKEKGCKDYYIEIGGEIIVAGKNPDGEDWRIGIDKPVALNDGKNERVIQEIISLKNKAVATSGNYRKFYKKNGKIYAHTLNPKTGRPAENELLSATVVTDNAAEADGMATAFMVMGLSKAKAFLNKHPQYDGFFIYRGENNELKSYASSGMQKMIQ